MSFARLVIVREVIGGSRSPRSRRSRADGGA